jgi:hypothetical protein
MPAFWVIFNNFAMGWAKVTLEWDHSEETTQEHEEVLKPPFIKLVSKILLKILNIFNWGVRYIFWIAFSWIEKNEELGDTILQCKLSHVKKVKVAWNLTLWEWESNKFMRLEKCLGHSWFPCIKDHSWMIFLF